MTTSKRQSAKARRQAVEFFYRHGAYSYDPKRETRIKGRWRCAREMAYAEQQAHTRGYQYEWEHDPDGDLGDHEYWCDRARDGETHEHEILSCLLRDATGHVLASLGSIIDPSRDYGRVIEAELALEALAQDTVKEMGESIL